MVQVSFDATALKKALKQASTSWEKNLNTELDQLAKDIADRVKNNYWKHQTRKAFNNTAYVRHIRYGRIVRVNVDYASYLNDGTRPHVIEARRAKALKFNGIFRKRVMHPGTTGYHYAEKESKYLDSIVAFRVEKALEKALKQAKL